MERETENERNTVSQALHGLAVTAQTSERKRERERELTKCTLTRLRTLHLANSFVSYCGWRESCTTFMALTMNNFRITINMVGFQALGLRMASFHWGAQRASEQERERERERAQDKVCVHARARARVCVCFVDREAFVVLHGWLSPCCRHLGSCEAHRRGRDRDREREREAERPHAREHVESPQIRGSCQDTGSSESGFSSSLRRGEI